MSIDEETAGLVTEFLSPPPCGVDGPECSRVLTDRIREVSKDLGRLVFEDPDWWDAYGIRDIRRGLDDWLDDDTAGELAKRAHALDEHRGEAAYWPFIEYCCGLVHTRASDRPGGTGSGRAPWDNGRVLTGHPGSRRSH
ncbi:hypothetical protein ACIRS1_05410 [Kitasatospora sp. NPDC101176]|uniref:hypothetical protein n=1 Tax=Kitasatospora sp. NPDC101176 TaxID=3364099 RepID=UPI00380BB719